MKPICLNGIGYMSPQSQQQQTKQKNLDITHCLFFPTQIGTRNNIMMSKLRKTHFYLDFMFQYHIFYMNLSLCPRV